MKRPFSRRDLLKVGGTLAFSSACMSNFKGLQQATALSDTTGYKALVCVYLSGGLDAFNLLVPTSSAGFSTYAGSRGSMALAQSSLLPLNGVASDGYSYGLHPMCPELQALFNGGKLAFVNNVGTLVQPTTKTQAQGGSVPLPPQLFSHIDQQTLWMTSIANSPTRNGWCGRMADMYASQGYSNGLPMNFDIGSPLADYLQAGQTTSPYVYNDSAPVLTLTSDTDYRSGARAQAAQALLTQAVADASPLVRQFASIQQTAATHADVINSALAAAGDLVTAFPSGSDTDQGFGQILHTVARTIKAASQISAARQVFFISLGGFDTHNGELATLNNLLHVLSSYLNTFWTAMGELGMQNNVTVFTASEFGRTLAPNSNGTDHGWGSHAMVLGGAVKGGYYGKMPSLLIGGPDDFGTGRMVPTTSTDQYAATLASWFGVSAADLATLFPNLKNFPVANLGFMG